MLESPVIVLGSGKDGTQRVAKRIKRDNIGVADGRHGIKGRRGAGVGKGLTAG